MVNKWIAENQSTAVVSVAEKYRYLITKKLEQIIANFKTHHEHTKGELQQKSWQ